MLCMASLMSCVAARTPSSPTRPILLPAISFNCRKYSSYSDVAILKDTPQAPLQLILVRWQQQVLQRELYTVLSCKR